MKPLLCSALIIVSDILFTFNSIGSDIWIYLETLVQLIPNKIDNISNIY